MRAAAALPPPADGPRRITFLTSPDRCNLRCEMCRDHSPYAAEHDGPERLLPLSVVARVLEERSGSALAEVIPSTRGEPLLWPDLPRLLDLCRTHGLAVNLTTNGTFPRGGAARWAARLVLVASDVKISWNGATAATAEAIMRGLRFEDALAGAAELVRARDTALARGGRPCRVSFQVTAQEANVAEIPDIVRLAIRLGVDRVKVNQLQVHHPELAGADLRRSPESRARWNRAVAAARAAAAGAAIALENLEELDEGGREAPRGPCPFLGREAWIAADGAFLPCPAPAAADGAFGDLGSIHVATLGEIWAGEPYRALVAGYRDHAACVRCPLRRPGGA